MLRSFKALCILVFSTVLFSLSGCKTFNIKDLDLGGLFDVSPTVVGVVSNTTCYKHTSQRGFFLVSGPTCGADTALPTTWLQNDVRQSRGQYEVNRVSGEYQVALNNNLYGTSQYRIRSFVPQGDLLIELRIFPSKDVDGVHTCRVFFERIIVNGSVSASENKTVCRERYHTWAVFDK